MNHRIAGAIFRIHELNEKTTFEIFIHKVDGMSETYRQGLFHYCALTVPRLTAFDVQTCNKRCPPVSGTNWMI